MESDLSDMDNDMNGDSRRYVMGFDGITVILIPDADVLRFRIWADNALQAEIRIPSGKTDNVFHSLRRFYEGVIEGLTEKPPKRAAADAEALAFIQELQERVETFTRYGLRSH